jgi:hypothetical protein
MEEDVYYKGYKIKIRQDEFAESPDDWGNEDLFLVYDHRQFTVKREGFNPLSIYNWLYAKNIVDFNDDVDGDYQEEVDSYPELNSYWIFPVEAYIHSGVYLSLFSGTKQCRWDSSVSGYILASKEEFESEEAAKNAAEGLIETWNQYLSGDVCGFIVEKANAIYTISKEKFDRLLFENDLSTLESEFDVENEWEEVDSCWGFYGQDTAIDEAKMVIDNLIKNEK